MKELEGLTGSYMDRWNFNDFTLKELWWINFPCGNFTKKL